MHRALHAVPRGFKKKDAAEPTSEVKELSIAELLGIMVAEVGVSPSYFLDQMTPREVNAVMVGYNEKVKRELIMMRRGWYFSVAPYAKGHFTEEDIVKYSWEQASAELPDIDSEEFKEHIKKLNNELNG